MRAPCGFSAYLCSSYPSYRRMRYVRIYALHQTSRRKHRSWRVWFDQSARPLQSISKTDPKPLKA